MLLANAANLRHGVRCAGLLFWRSITANCNCACCLLLFTAGDAVAALLQQAVQHGSAGFVCSLRCLPAAHSCDPEAVAGLLQQVLLQGDTAMGLCLTEVPAAEHIPAQRMQQLLQLVPVTCMLQLRGISLFERLLALPGAAAMVSCSPRLAQRLGHMCGFASHPASVSNAWPCGHPKTRHACKPGMLGIQFPTTLQH